MSTEKDNIKIGYSYRFKNGSEKAFNISLDRQTLSLVSGGHTDPPIWTKLYHNKCINCSLNEETNRYCPVALNLAHIVDEFKDFFSHENVSVTVTTEERAYSKNTSLQEGLSSLIGIVMVTSGCPVMEKLKPMVRFHLPFATIEETIFRMVSIYLVAQYYLNLSGSDADWKLDGLKDIYSEVGQVNRDFAQRLRDATKRDANLNALVNLDCFAAMVPLTAEQALKEIEDYFSAYKR